MPLTEDPSQAGNLQLVLVTGPSGAGRSTTLHAFEDLGYEAIDNLPISLIPRLISGPAPGGPLVLGVDTRNREFSSAAVTELFAQLKHDPRVQAEILYIDCSADRLLRRFSETRRRHPMAPAESPDRGIALELDLLAPIRAWADALIDTTEMSPHDLRAEIAARFDLGDGARLAVSIHSFSYKRGIPRAADMVFDCRFLQNPYWQDRLRGLDGISPDVSAYVARDPLFDGFFAKVLDLILLLLPAYTEEGKSHLSIALGCTGGQHRSVVVAEKLADALAAAGWRVSKRHRELERKARIDGNNTMGTTA